MYFRSRALALSLCGLLTCAFINVHVRQLVPRGVLHHGPLAAQAQALANVVTTEWLEDHLDDPDVVIVDIRGEVEKTFEGSRVETVYGGCRDAYLTAHIPGAVFVDWTSDIAREVNGVPVQLIPEADFITAMEERGIGHRKTVVAYDDGRMLFATRLWWALRVYGFHYAHVLDGGWAKWSAENRRISADVPCPLKLHHDWGVVETGSKRFDLVCGLEDVREALAAGGGGTQLIDARGSDQFTGEVRRAHRGGRVPGALNVPYRSMLEEVDEGVYVLKTKEKLRATLEGAGVDFARPLMAYCNGGVASTLVAFALFQLGRDDCRNYDGSWNEWGNREDTPVETDR